MVLIWCGNILGLAWDTWFYLRKSVSFVLFKHIVRIFKKIVFNQCEGRDLRSQNYEELAMFRNLNISPLEQIF